VDASELRVMMKCLRDTLPGTMTESSTRSDRTSERPIVTLWTPRAGEGRPERSLGGRRMRPPAHTPCTTEMHCSRNSLYPYTPPSHPTHSSTLPTWV
jgi:hypothetical protein